MKLNHTFLNLFLLALLVNWQFSYCQTEAPSSPAASAITQYADYPVNYFTGMPSISVPLYSLPTKDPNVTIPLVVNYHAGSLAGDFENSGNCGRGWSINPGATISRRMQTTPDEVSYKYYNKVHGTNVYEFNIMGISGKFRTERINTSSNTLYGVVANNYGPKFRVGIINDANFAITEIIITDNNGYRYHFKENERDTYIYVKGQDRLTLPSSFNLTNIYDQNNRLLVTYTYTPYIKVETYHNSGESNKVQVLTSISSHYFGRADFQRSGNADFFRYESLVIKDNYLRPVRQFEFKYSSPVAPYTLAQIDEGPSVFNSPDKRSYRFEYKQMVVGYYKFNLVEDKWKYNRLLIDGCLNRGESDIYSTMGVLEKMTLPTGGSIVYEFEQNNYSWRRNKPLDLVLNEIHDNFFLELPVPVNGGVSYYGSGDENWRNNLHNFNVNSIVSGGFLGPGSVNFSASGYTFVRLTGKQYSIPGVGFGWPNFELKASGSFLPMASFSHGSSSYNVDENLMCLGKQFNLGGNYTLSMTAPNSTATGNFEIFSLTPVAASQVKKWWYGAGIRIKSISYYTTDVEKPYPTEAERKISYDYNLFDEPNRSSGVLFKDYASTSWLVSSHLPTLGYENVTVRDSKTGGRIEYDYFTTMDVLTNDYDKDLTIGKLQRSKIFDNSDNLLQQTDFTYDQEISYVGVEGGLNVTGWVDVSQVDNYYYNSVNSGSSSVPVMTIDNYEYDENKQLSKHIQSSGVAGENLETRYTYNEAYFGVFVPETVTKYRNGELISKLKNTYYTIPMENYSGPIPVYTSFQLKDSQVAKADNNLETISTVKYDNFNHVLEAKKENGVTTSFIWGYNETQIVAKIEGVAYSDIDQNLILAAKEASEFLSPNSSESNLLIALTNLRNSHELINAYVTTYTYKSPLIGISTVTDSRGRKLSYEYDINNRLINVKDQEGNILSETEYHIIP